MEKSRDIAILKTMGTAPKRIMAIFMMQGLIIGITGTVVGGVGGLGLCWVLDHYRLIKIPADVYQVSYVPFVVLPFDFAVVIVSAIVICLIEVTSIRPSPNLQCPPTLTCGLRQILTLHVTSPRTIQQSLVWRISQMLPWSELIQC